MIDPAISARFGRLRNFSARTSPTGRPPTLRLCILPKLDITNTPSVKPPNTSGSFREEVPIPLLKSQVIIPVPPPTLPSATGPPLAVVIASSTLASLTWRPAMSLSQLSSHSPTMGMITSCSSPIPGYRSIMYRATPSETAPTEMVLVSRIGVSINPHSITWVRPETSPAPFKTNPPPVIRSEKMLPVSGMIAVTPVRTGPCPGRRGPEPRIIVQWPTRTPSTSVIALYLPGLKRPSGKPSSRARTRGSLSSNQLDIGRELTRRAPRGKACRRSSLGFGPLVDGCGQPFLDRLDRAAVSSLALLPLLVPADCPAENFTDQGPVIDAFGLGDQHQVAPSRR